MKTYLEIVKLQNDIITASGCAEDCECYWGCGDDLDQAAGNF